jgi:CDP-diacylglycerol pyrophosphatase
MSAGLTRIATFFCACLLSLSAPASDRDALRRIVQDECMVHWLKQQSAAPCERLYLRDDGSGAGYALLADRKGGAHFLLIPTQTMAGIESPAAREPGGPNYFAAAWAARDLVAAAAGRPLSRSAFGMALNPKHARSQDQLHIHMECLRAEVVAALKAASGHLSSEWSPVSIAGWHYDALRILGEDLGESNPLRRLADRPPDARASLEDYSLILAGMQFKEGPGFVLLAGTGLAGELLLDSTCAAA